VIPEIEELLHKAKRSILAAEVLFRQGDYDFAASRAYYSMFYLAEACLLSKTLSFSKHSGVISGFNQHFVKTGMFEEKYSAMLRNAFSQRNIGDYGIAQHTDEEAARTVIDDAKEFLAVTEPYLEGT